MTNKNNRSPDPRKTWHPKAEQDKHGHWFVRDPDGVGASYMHPDEGNVDVPATAPPEPRQEVAWLVESVIDGKSNGWWSQPTKGVGGWLTTNAWEAKRYTEAEAKAVAVALDYFPAPSGYFHWVATEHVFIAPVAENIVPNLRKRQEDNEKRSN